MWGSAPTEAARPATREDLDDVAALAAMAIAELGQQRGGDVWRRRHARPEDPRPSLEALLEDRDALLLVGSIDDVVVGYAATQVITLVDGSRLALLDDLYTRPEARDVGVGEAMMDATISWARESGCFGIDSLALPGDRQTKNFFESFGLVARAILVHRTLGGSEE